MDNKIVEIIKNSSLDITDVESRENNYDYSDYYNGKVTLDGKVIGEFYEHPLEGGYYQNGEFENKSVFFSRAIAMFKSIGNLDLRTSNIIYKSAALSYDEEMDLFHEVIMILLEYYFINKNTCSHVDSYSARILEEERVYKLIEQQYIERQSLEIYKEEVYFRALEYMRQHKYKKAYKILSALKRI